MEGYLGYLALLNDDLEAAASWFRGSLEGSDDLGDEWGLAEAMERLAALAAARANDEHAARIEGAAEALRERLAARSMPFDRLMLGPLLAAARTRAGAERWSVASDEGRRMPLDEAIRLAVDEEGQGSHHQRGAPPGS